MNFSNATNAYVTIIKAILFAIPFIPLYISSSLPFPYITGKNFLFRLLIELAVALWIPLIATSKDYRPKNSPLVITIFLFTFIIGLANLFGVNSLNSFWSNSERMEGYITILHLAMYFVIITSIFKSRSEWMSFFSLCLIVSFLTCIVAWIFPETLNKAHLTRYEMEYGNRMRSTLGNPPFFAAYLMLSFFIGLILIINTKRIILKSIYSIIIVSVLVTIYVTGARGAILSVFAGISVSIIFLIHFYVKTHTLRFPFKYFVIFVMLLIVILALLLTGSHFNGTSVHNTLSRFTNVMTDSSVQSRLDIWKMSIEGIKARPFLGWGQENFIGIYTVNPIPLVDSQVWMDRAHNIIIDWTVNAGIMGLVSYLLIFAGAFYSLRSALKARSMSYVENIVIVTTLSVYFLHNLFIFDTINTYVLFFTLLSYVSHGASANEPFVMNNSFGTPSRKEDIKLISITCVTLLTFSLACYFLHYRPIKGLQLSLRASKSVSPSSSYSHLLNDFNKALSSSPFIVRDVLLQMTQVSDYIFRYKLFSNVAALSFIDKNAKKLESSISANSFNLQYLSLITNFYFKIANYEPAFIEVTERLIKKNIHINSQYEWLNIILADVQILKGNYVDAVKNMQSIVDKDPMNDQKRIYLLIAAIIANKDIIAEDSLKKIKDLRLRRFKNEMTDNSQIFSIYELHLIARAYSKRADYFIAIQNYKDITRILSNKETLYKDSDFQYTKPYFKALVHFETAQNYIYINDEENALKEVKKAMKLDPLSFSDAIDWLYN